MNHLIRDFAEPVRVAAGAGAAPGRGGVTAPKRVLYLSSPIGLGHARRDLAIAAALREQHPGVRIDWLAQHPVTARARGGRRAGAPGAAACSPTSRRTSRTRPASTTCTASRRCGGWTRSCVANFMVFDDVVRDGDVRPRGRRRGLGRRPLPAREPRAQAVRVRVAHRLRRLPADAGRRRPGGAGHRRLQRRDDRAHRPVSADPRPGDLRRRPGRHRRRAVRPRAARASATGPEEHYDFAGYVTGFDRAAVADRDALRAASATARTSGCAW